MCKVKIGIVTLSASDNCGSLLQTYALQEYLKREHDAEVKVINLVAEASDKLYALIPPEWYKHPKKFIFSLRFYAKNKKQKMDYAKYRNEKLQLSDKVYRSCDDLEQLDKDCELDILITGSDQIWNVNMTDFSEMFFLPIETKAKKIAYAASLGGMVQIPDEWKVRIKSWLEAFAAISVREPSGAKTISAVTSKSAPVLCDPTLLHDSAFWQTEAGERKVQEPYIFFYSWAYPDYEMNSLVQRFASEKQMPVYVINSSKWYKFRPEKFNFCLYEQSGPEAFLNLMAHAEYVFVQSFHGVVFANLLKKKFCFLNEQVGQIDFRAGNFLKMLHEETQIVHSYDEIEKAFHSELIYQSEELSQLIKSSKEYLREQV